MEHGKRWTWVKYKCRCESCTAANTAYMEDYRRKNKAKILAREAERYGEQKERIIARQAAYYERERVAILDRQRAPAFRVKRAERQAERRAREVGQFVEVISRQVVYRTGNRLCGICGEHVGWHGFQVDHIVPLSLGGLHAYRNCQPAHAKCNERKHNRLPTIEELERSN